MSPMSHTTCGDESRRERVRAHATNGLDYVEVSLTDEHGRPIMQPMLAVYFLGKAPEQEITAANVRIEGGRRIPARDIRVVGVEVVRDKDPELDDSLSIRLSKSGDFSTYTLRLVESIDGRPSDRDFPGFDRRYSRVEFTFSADCPSDLDCATGDLCLPAKPPAPEIGYLAKDFASFRQLIFDRLALIMPDWRERHVPDLGVTLVELLAYVGDHLSYQQDAVATEAYLETSRQRISVRRHARLVDYAMHEGCNARAWVSVETTSDVKIPIDDVFFVTGHNDALAVVGTVVALEDLARVPPDAYEVFEPMSASPGASIALYRAHSEMRFYTWATGACCLEQGATSATLRDEWVGGWVDPAKPPPEKIPPQKAPPEKASIAKSAASQGQSRVKPPAAPPAPVLPERELQNLKAGDVLIFEEVIGPGTGNPADADPLRRHAVRLTRVTPIVDTLYDPPVPVVDIEWAVEDRLPFTLCLSAVVPTPGCPVVCDITVAHGNVVLVDHGETIRNEPLGTVDVQPERPECEGPNHPGDLVRVGKRFRPRLTNAPLTFSGSAEGGAATLTLMQDPRAALPQIRVTSAPASGDESGASVPLVDVLELEDRVRAAALVARLRTPTNARLRQLRSMLPKKTVEVLDHLNAGADPPREIVDEVVAALTALLERWTPRRDLLASAGGDLDFVTEIANDGRARLRFGNNELGRMPAAGETFTATYRIGNGSAGNVGAESISRVVFRRTLSGAVLRVRNPLPAQGGIEPESAAEVKLLAPTAIERDLQRAITAGDYAELARRDFAEALQRATCSLRWAGSWYEVEIAVDPFGSEDESRTLERAIEKRLRRYRRIGHDVSARPATYVPLDIELTVCVAPHYLRGHVEAALLDVFSNRALPDGRFGFFHPDRLTFGDDIFVSALVAAAQNVTGVSSVVVTRLQRRFDVPDDEIADGVLALRPDEIPQLDNDPNVPERGRFSLVMKGGR
jgi:predicted phage baseplate assembly protein